VMESFLPPQPITGCRPALGEGEPTPWEQEVVVFTPFFYQRLGLPVCDFAHQVLDFYKLELSHLNPNGILHLSIFIHLCEAFLGVHPHLPLFGHLFLVKPQPNKARPSVLGGAGIQLRSSRVYIPMRLIPSNKGWHPLWFYCKNPLPALPSFTGRAPSPIPEWNYFPSAEEQLEVDRLVVGIKDLANRRLTACIVMDDFLRHRVQPLKQQSHPAWEYSGDEDLTREAFADFPEDDLSHLLNTCFSDLGSWPSGRRPLSYSLRRPRPEVPCFLY
jgi:hypothetical protein